MNKLKEKNGITLIALVITIIVLLILAGVAIATLTGDNGILTQSQKAKYASIYKEAEEQVQLATMAVKAEIAGRKAKLGTYNATDPDSINALKAIVATDLVSEGSGFEVADPVDGATLGTKLIKIRYSNTALKAGGIDDGNPPVPAQTGHVNYIIIVTAGDAELTTNITDEEYESGNIGNGGQTEEPQEPETPVVTTVTVSFYENKGDSTAITTKQVDSGSSMGSSNMPANPTKSGYAFAGWKKSSDDSAFTDSTTVSADTSVYADWIISTATYGAVNTAYVADFGKIVTGYEGYASYASSDVWRLFYADSSRAYLIKNSIGNYSLNNSTLFPDYNTVTGNTISNLGKNFNPGCTATFWTTNASYANKKGTAVLINPENFAEYANSYAYWAVGGPTVEMFNASYNVTHTADAITAYKATAGHSNETLVETQLACQVASDSAYGYQVKKGSEDWAPATGQLGNSSALDRAIYCPSSGFWWLASPDANNNNEMLLVNHDYGGAVSNYDCVSNNVIIGIRPLVSVPISKIGNGITITSNY